MAREDSRFNEETVKNRYLLPFLERLGFRPSDLSFETRIVVQIGRNSQDLTQRTGVLDILVRRGDENLFLVEAKRQGATLTEADRDQGLSYASLVRPIAPYVVVTNGEEFRIYETLTSQEISDKRITPDSEYSVAPPPSLIEEAISHFLGHSEENLLTFCQHQTAEEMMPLLGSRPEARGKYIPDLFVERGTFTNEISEFSHASEALFALVADAGSGKTCCLCHFTRTLLAEGRPVLFYRGVNLRSSILEAVTSDFNWTFSESLSGVSLTRRLARVTHGRGLTIVIDAIDEWEHAQRRQDLLATVRHLSHQPGIKLVVSCKAEGWNEFTTARGAPSGMNNYLGEKYGKTGCFILEPMSEREFSRAIEKYRSFFGVSAPIEDLTLEVARRSPFFLRVLFSVAQVAPRSTVPNYPAEIFSEYLRQAVARLTHPKQALHTLVAVARELFSTSKDRIDRFDLMEHLGPGHSSRTVHELIQFQLLEATPTDHGEQVGFYFSLLRDYLVAFRSQKWNLSTAAEFSQSVAQLGSSTVHQEALAFFYRYASPDKQRMIDEEARKHALELLRIYERTIGEHFYSFREQFAPYTRGRIGYVGTFVPRSSKLGFATFRPISDDKEEVLLQPTPQRRLYTSTFPHLHGARGIVGSAARAKDEDIRDWVINTAIGHQLRRIVKEGLLDESQEVPLAQEAVLALVSRTSRSYGGEPHPFYLRRKPPNSPLSIEDLLPLEVRDVKKWINYRLLRKYFYDQRIEENLAAGRIPVREHDNGSISYSANLDHESTRIVDEKTEARLKLSDREIRSLVRPSKCTQLRDLDDRISRALDSLSGEGISAIERELFPEWRELSRYLSHGSWIHEEICRFIERVLHVLLNTFTSLVRWNFPTLWSQFPTVQWQPMTMVAVVELERGDRRNWSAAELYLCETQSRSNRIIARPREVVDIQIQREPPWSLVVHVDDERFVRYELDSDERGLGQRHLSLNRLLFPSDDYLGEIPGVSAGPRTSTLLRTLVYDWLREELALIFRRFCNTTGANFRNGDWTFYR